ncbi:MAG: NfeD family protein [Oscillatoria sp. PMC 1051.18]|uniref:NfeD family protein n=1 Tax=Oscillatoria salina TaxID=331517 RepID=UPI0013BD5198|nr:NfeD family protein [Oscillatoria salina]MBZ8179581.1 hypothetical protein [Oscillatoria salina IIICB1]MEC4891423.1 NfeD family protein [Oscillatoria sp. PMC 1050.18]MEC5028970.1 NfeD family protein [Oscillatoria sp. PMC 1051.18]NET88984.1 hypothetical protein [Kamptonema sp. SIO1D9]
MFSSRLIPQPVMFEKLISGRVTVAIAPDKPGRVAFQGSFYPAKLSNPTCQKTLKPGDICTIVGRESITLLVNV